MNQKFLLLITALFLFTYCYSQVTVTGTPYNCSTLTDTLTAHLTGDIPIDAGITTDDYYSGGIQPIGFTFKYYNATHTNCLIGPNGVICFDLTQVGLFENWSITSALLGNVNVLDCICGPWCDMDLVYGGACTYSTDGVAPNRKFVVTFCHDAMFYPADCGTQYTTTQIILYETTNLIEVHITHKTICTAWNGGYAICGVQNAAGTAATAAPGRDFPTRWAATNEAWCFTPNAAGTSYTVATIPYAPIPYSSSTIYWYDSTTGAYLGTGNPLIVTPIVTTTYRACALGCSDTSSGYYTVVVTSSVHITTVTGTNPSSCGTCDGTITLHGITPGSSDTLTYSFNGIVQPVIITTALADSSITITGLCAGIYSNFSVKIGGCIAYYAGPVTLSTPPGYFLSLTGTNPTVCGACNGTITLHGIGLTGTPDTVKYKYNGVAQPPVVTVLAAGGSITLTGLCEGTYSNFSVKVGNCIDTNNGTVVLSDPPFTISGTLSTSPTACGLCDGTITLEGLVSGTSDTVNYSLGGVPQPAVVAIVSAAGTITLTGLCSGVYSGITVKMNDCITPPVGPITLNNLSFTISGPTTICVGGTATFTATTPGTWTSNNTAVATIVAGTGLFDAVAFGVTTVTFTTTGGCTATQLVTVNATPTITGITTICSGTTTLLGNSVTGGTWSSTNTIVATVNPSSGLVSGLTGGTTTISYLTGSGCTTATGLLVYNSPGPISGITNVCIDANTTLTDPVTGGIWTSNNTAIATVGAATGIVTGVATGTDEITYTLSGGCYTITTVTVNPNPPTITGTATLCAGANSILSDPLAGGIWNSTNTTIATVNDTSGFLHAVAAGTVNINYTLPTGCFTTVPVMVDPLPGAIYGTTVVCTGLTTTLFDALTGGTWTTGNFAIATIDPVTGVVNGITPGTVTITYTLPTGCDTVTSVLVNLTPNIDSTSFTDPTTCTSNNGIITIYGLLNSATYNLYYTISGIPFSTAAVSNTSGQIVITNLAPGSYTNIYVVSLAGCTSNTILGPITLVPPSPPPAPTPVDTVYCQYQSAVALTASGTGTLLWYNTAVGGTGSLIAPTPPTNVAGILNYYVTQLVDSCESPRALLTVTVNPKPQPPTVFPPVYCQYATPVSVLSVSPTVGITWYGPGTTTGYSIAPTPTDSFGGTVDYYVTQTLLGCISDRATYPVTVIPLPPPPTVSDTFFCLNDTNIPALTAIGSNLLWYIALTGSSPIPAPVPSTSVIGTSSWYVTQTVNGCTGPDAQINVTIFPLPSFTAYPLGTFVCQNDTITLVCNLTAGYAQNIKWTIPKTDTLLGGTIADPYILVQYDSLYGEPVTVTVNSGGFCNMTDTVIVNVIPQPVATAYLKPDICAGDTVTLALSGKSYNAINFTWDFAGAFVTASNSNSGGPFSLYWADSGMHIIKLNATSPEGCPSQTNYDTVKIHALPVSTILNPPGQLDTFHTVCIGDSLRFSCADTLNYNNSYVWSPSEYFNNVNSPIIWGKVQLAGNVYLQVTDPWGCTSTSPIGIDPHPCCTIWFPNAFTPGSDICSQCKTFGPLFEQRSEHNFHIFRITNRWGQTIFETTNNHQQWDGTFNGVPQDLGVYFWYIEYDCAGSKQTAHGDVTLVR